MVLWHSLFLFLFSGLIMTESRFCRYGVVAGESSIHWHKCVDDKTM